jgi:glycopeptide antibiotics resistance protein
VWWEEAEYAFVFFFALTLIFILPWVHHEFRTFGRFHRWPMVLSMFIVGYACALVAFTLFPLPRSLANYCEVHADTSHWQLEPFVHVGEIADYASQHTWLQTLTSAGVLQIVFNVVLFVPLGFLLAYRWRQPFVRSVAIALGITLLIELTQGTGVWGLAECAYRLADVSDLILNTLGGVLGWWLGRKVGHHLPDPQPLRQTDLDDPTAGRRIAGEVLDVVAFMITIAAVLLMTRWLGQAPERGGAAFAAVIVVVSGALFVVFPLMRAARVTPGDMAVRIMPVDVNGQRASVGSVCTLWAMRWLPVAVFGLAAIVVVVAVDGIVAWRRRDGRTLTEVIARLTYRTVDQQQMRT